MTAVSVLQRAIFCRTNSELRISFFPETGYGPAGSDRDNRIRNDRETESGEPAPTG